MKYDIEKLEADLLALVKSKLPAKLTEIYTDKGDAITLEVPTNSQYFNSTDIDEQIVNENLMVRYGLEESEVVSISSATNQTGTFSFIIYLNDMNPEPGVLRKKLLRYTRAFKEIFEENFDQLTFVSNIGIKILAPAVWAENENSPAYKIGGVILETSLAS